MCHKAKEWMEKLDADFVATGELVGQRPSSQKMHQLALINRESGLEGRLVRPLSAGMLPPTVPESEGLLNREKLFSFTGRSRTNLIRLSRDLNVGPVPQPSTGCLLCEKTFAPRVFDLVKHEPNPTVWDVDVLSAGRQIRLNPDAKCVVARNLAQCERLEALYARSDANPAMLFIPANFNGPSAMYVNRRLSEKSEMDETAIQEAITQSCDLIVRHSNADKLPPVPTFHIPQK